MTDAELMVEYVRDQSADAFAAIVQRYANLVYSTARRMIVDAHDAEDVTQAAFIVLMKKAKTIDPSTLAGWLVNATRLAAREAMRSKRCRFRHEKRAAQTQPEFDHLCDEPTMRELTSILDEALSRLNELDRSAVALRFLQGWSFAEVGRTIGTSEDTARKRVERAVVKLRQIFMHEGISPSEGGLMLMLASQQATDAPAEAIRHLSGMQAAGASSRSLTLARGAICAMNWAKIKVAAMVLIALSLAGGLGLQTIRQARAQQTTQAVTSLHQESPVDLLQRYPTQLTSEDSDPSHARPWQFTAADIYHVSHFSLAIGKDLQVNIASADMGIGHCQDGALWAVLIPRDAGTLTSRVKGLETVANLWLRFNPGEIDRLFPPDTVSTNPSSDTLYRMLAIARVKIISSWQADGNAMIPGPKDLTVDVDVTGGARRFFAVDRDTGTAQYFPVFADRFVREPHAPIAAASTMDAGDLWSESVGAILSLAVVLCLAILAAIVVAIRRKARLTRGK